MPQSFVTINGVVSSALAAAGTLTVSYPTGIEGGMFRGNNSKHRLNVLGAALLAESAHFSVALNAASCVVTLGTGRTTIPAGTPFQLQLEMADEVGLSDLAGNPANLHAFNLHAYKMGFIDTASSTALAASQSVSSGVAASLDGTTYLTAGIQKFDTPRNVVAAWTTTAVITIVGLDMYGQAMVETSASGTSHTGKKAFSVVTSITPSASITGFTAGHGVVYGLPFFIGDKADLFQLSVDGVVEATAPTIVVGDSTTPSGTTGDVRGTFTPNTAANSAKAFSAILAGNPTKRGITNYTV